MVRVTISGLPGSGTSTLVGGICESLNWTASNRGDLETVYWNVGT